MQIKLEKIQSVTMPDRDTVQCVMKDGSIIRQQRRIAGCGDDGSWYIEVTTSVHGKPWHQERPDREFFFYWRELRRMAHDEAEARDAQLFAKAKECAEVNLLKS